MAKYGGPVMMTYAVIMLLGGIGGFVSKHSLPSLISGIVSAILLGVGYSMLTSRPKTGFGIGVAVALALTAVFILRSVQTSTDAHSLGRNIGLAVLSLAAAAVFGAAMKS